MNEQLFELIPSDGEESAEQTEAYEELKDLVVLHSLTPKQVLNLLAHVYQNESNRLNATFLAEDMPAALAFQYQKKIREFRFNSKRLLDAEIMYFTAIAVSDLPLAC